MRSASSWSLAIVAFECPDNRGPDVVEVGAQPFHPEDVIGADEALGDVASGGRVMVGEGAAPAVGVGGLVEAFAGELAQGLEHHVARGAVGTGLGVEHGLGHQARERVGDLPAVEVVAAGDGDRGGGVEGTGEDAESVEHDPFVVVEELVGPIHRRPQGLVPFHAPAPLAGEEPEPLVEVRGDIRRAHRRGPRRGELDRQRDPVHPPADLAHRRPLPVVPCRVGACIGRSIGEQLHRRALEQSWTARRLRRRRE